VPEARHDVQQQEQADHAADGDEEHRIDRGVDHALADRLELAGVRDVARERRREVAGLLARLHRGDVQRREGLRELLERRRERLAFPQHRDEPLYHPAPFAAALLLPERFDRLDERQPALISTRSSWLKSATGKRRLRAPHGVPSVCFARTLSTV